MPETPYDSPNQPSVYELMAMEIACAVVLKYGEGNSQEQIAAKEKRLWLDHPAWQAAYAALCQMSGETNRYFKNVDFS